MILSVRQDRAEISKNDVYDSFSGSDFNYII